MAATAGDAYSASNGIYPAWPPPCEDHENKKVCPKCMCRDYESEVVFKKTLAPNDVQGRGGYRLYIPKPHAARFSPANINGSEVITFCDVQMKSWQMGFRTIRTDGRAYLGKGWIKFAREKQLRAGDTVIFYEVRCGQRTRFFMIAVSYRDRLQLLGAPINYTN
ncbi:B3 domain-containing protein Os02g0764100-like [Corylus avellana]|uniref:B3 domain-containing protein Os02g0764100-like n=1 Tax=Corylus avellana TaxID=13451 RepID=UPI00286B7019|nr:B3 domain-containing protein Os02g0764100-like [Corylus avellana]